MPNPVIPLPEFPTVPQLPGVPQLARASAFFNNVTLATSAIQQFLWSSTQVKPTWGLFNAAGAVVISPDNYLGLENSNDWKVSDFPLQDGQFSAYNKVVIPFTVSVKITKGGSLQQRKTLLQQLDAIAGDTNVYKLIVPEKSYLKLNITSYRQRRMGSEGAYYFADLEIFFRNIQASPSQYSSTTANTINAQNPNATPPQNLGVQSAVTTVSAVTSAQAAAAIANTPF